MAVVADTVSSTDRVAAGSTTTGSSFDSDFLREELRFFFFGGGFAGGGGGSAAMPANKAITGVEAEVFLRVGVGGGGTEDTIA